MHRMPRRECRTGVDGPRADQVARLRDDHPRVRVWEACRAWARMRRMNENTPGAPTSAIERRDQLLRAMREDGGAWDWVRARASYVVQPDPRTVRRDLEQLRKAGAISRDRETGMYQAGL
ncbi:hypothetical protein FHX73_114747 [Kitasatospora viridis]|uniref:Uncharacterized protein n=2 Tax=Kitasatospora viridis TaxID=281105 RepID=A0A561UND8_9ACTN|nr:hypothetical protein FHX73_114747 [Kitasatospora viridis]